MNNAQPLLPVDLEVASLESVASSLGRALVSFSLKLLIAVFILVVGMWIVNRIILAINRVMKSRGTEASVQTFLMSLLNIILKLFVVVIVLATVGVHMTSIVAVLGAAALAVGMALSGTLQNFAGGVVIMLFKPFKVGDVIEATADEVGTVQRIMIFTTEIRTFDNQIIFLPNGTLANGAITNLSRAGVRRVDLSLNIAYGADMDTVRRVVLKILSENKCILRRPNPMVYITALVPTGITVGLRYWVRYKDAFDARASILEQIYQALPKQKIKFVGAK